MSEPDYIPAPEEGDNQAVIDVQALVHQYHERPDLLLDALEKHHPGFIARMNEEALNRQKEFGSSRFEFGRKQANVSLWVSVAAAATILASVLYMTISGTLGFFNCLGLGVLYAITQGGKQGFVSLIKACGRAILSFRNKD